MQAEIHQLQKKPATITWMCSACGVDAGCNCGAPLMSKAQRAAEAIKANPQKSDRAIAEEIGVDHKTVGAARKSGGEDSPTEREGRDGKSYPMRPRVTAKSTSEDAPRDVQEAIDESRLKFLSIALEAVEDAEYCNTCDLSPVLRDKQIIQAVNAAAAAWCQLAAKLETEGKRR